jgi:hypothetical protein
LPDQLRLLQIKIATLPQDFIDFSSFRGACNSYRLKGFLVTQTGSAAKSTRNAAGARIK